MTQWTRWHRSLSRYEELAGEPLTSNLSSGALWVDLGTGPKARALNDGIGTGLRLVGINDEPIAEESHRDEIAIVIARLPEQIATVTPILEQAELVTDIYGPFSYVVNPLDLFLETVYSLRPGAKLVCVSDVGRLGNAMDLRRISAFCAGYLGVEMRAKTFHTTSDFDGRKDLEMRIVAVKGNQMPTFSLAAIRMAAVERIGTVCVGEVLFQPPVSFGEQAAPSIRSISFIRSPRKRKISRKIV